MIYCCINPSTRTSLGPRSHVPTFPAFTALCPVPSLCFLAITLPKGCHLDKRIQLSFVPQKSVGFDLPIGASRISQRRPPIPRFGAKAYYYCPQCSWVKVIFSQVSVSHSVHRGRVYPSMPPGQTPPGQTPPRQTPPGQTPCPVHAGYTPSPSSHCCGRYASYWNAFLFGKVIAENCMKMREIGPTGGIGVHSATVGSINGLDLACSFVTGKQSGSSFSRKHLQ